MMRAVGEMPEWPNGTDSKSVVLATVPRVRIPISPPYIENPCKSSTYEGAKKAFCTNALYQNKIALICGLGLFFAQNLTSMTEKPRAKKSELGEPL